MLGHVNACEYIVGEFRFLQNGKAVTNSGREALWTDIVFHRSSKYPLLPPIWEGLSVGCCFLPVDALVDWISLDESNLQGVSSLLPQNPQNVYIACGTYTSSSNGATRFLR